MIHIKVITDIITLLRASLRRAGPEPVTHPAERTISGLQPFGVPEMTAVTDNLAWTVPARPWHGLSYPVQRPAMSGLQPFGLAKLTAATDILAWTLAARPQYGLFYPTQGPCIGLTLRSPEGRVVVSSACRGVLLVRRLAAPSGP
jgi:hypothetical protein